MNVRFQRYWEVAVAVIACSALLGWAARVSAAQAIRIGVVDVQMVLNQSERGKAAKQKLDQEMAARQKDLDAKQQEVMKLQTDFEKQAPLLSEQAKRDRSESIQRKVRDVRRLAEDANREIEKRVREAEMDVTREIFGVIQEYGKDQGFTIIFTPDPRTVAYSSSAVDITTEIIKRYDARQK